MSNIILVTIIIILVILLILLLNNLKNKPVSKVDHDIRRENEMLIKLLESKLNNQNQLLQTVNQAQNETIKEQISRIDANMIRTNKHFESYIRNMFEDIDTKQSVQTKKLDDKNLQFEKQLVKISRLDQSLSTLEERIVDLSMILGNAKARGNFGEIQLYQLINEQFGVQNDKIYKQCKLSNGTIVDLAVMSSGLNLLVGIDSKFPLENFLEFHQTGEIGFKNLFERDIKKHIDDISSKYIIGGETVNFAIMFIPSETIYIEIMENAKLVDYSYKKKVWLASPTTLIALITMLENVNSDYKRLENINRIEAELDKLSIEFERFNKRYNNLTRHMNQIIGDFEDIAITQNKLVSRFEAIKKMELEGDENE